MIVVADTSPLNYLVLIAEVEVLSALYDRILIPEEVHRDLQRLRTPPSVLGQPICRGGARCAR